VHPSSRRVKKFVVNDNNPVARSVASALAADAKRADEEPAFDGPQSCMLYESAAAWLICRRRGYEMAEHHPAATQPDGRAHARQSRAQEPGEPLPAARSADLGRLAGHLGYFVRRAQLWIFQDFIRTLAELDIRPAQYSVLLVIEANPGLSQATLGQVLGIERARLVRLLDGLEARKFVQRRRSKSDRRAHILSLTAQGRSALGRIKVMADAHEQRLARKVGSRNRKTLLRLLSGFAGS
jgi:DNA-binding MarR family transcriptional regulator